MFDTHCHLNFQAFDTYFNEVIKRAFDAGVKHITVPGTDLETSKKAIVIAESYENIYAAVGIHPTKDLSTVSLKSVIYKLEEIALSTKVASIGEIGLDYYRYRSSSAVQKQFFLAQLELSLKVDKSVIIHNRHASKDVLDILEGNWQNAYEGRMVFHCCEAEQEILNFAIKHDIFIGVDGDVTYDKEKMKFIKNVPLELLVIETDSPYIIPEPLHSKKVFPNEPKNLSYIAKKVAEIKKVAIEKLSETTLKNGLRLFGLT